MFLPFCVVSLPSGLPALFPSVNNSQGAPLIIAAAFSNAEERAFPHGKAQLSARSEFKKKKKIHPSRFGETSSRIAIF